MELFFAPFACSLASRIVINELGLEADYSLVENKTKTLTEGGSYLQVNPLGYVPALGLGGGDGVLTENTAILQYLADQRPQAGLIPLVGSADRYKMLQWLGFVSTELHSKIFGALFNPAVSDDLKAHIREKAASRFEHLSQHLDGREFLVERFTIADAYLVTILNWFEYAGLDMAAWPVLADYRNRLRRRPSVAKAMSDERPLLQAA